MYRKAKLSRDLAGALECALTKESSTSQRAELACYPPSTKQGPGAKVQEVVVHVEDR